MLDMSWGEVMVIGAVALIVIGPKDLPKALRTLGQMTGKVRRLAAEFQGQFAEAMREAELDDVKRQIQGVNESVSSFNPMQTIRDELKGAIEAPATAPENTPGETVADAAAQGRGEAHPPAPVEPMIALPIPSVPPIVDPAESVAEAVRQSAEVSSLETKPEAPESPAAKPNERAE
jgi:sec-independent protein translocase protein TatB